MKQAEELELTELLIRTSMLGLPLPDGWHLSERRAGDVPEFSATFFRMNATRLDDAPIRIEVDFDWGEANLAVFRYTARYC